MNEKRYGEPRSISSRQIIKQDTQSKMVGCRKYYHQPALDKKEWAELRHEIER
jgi:hypothetical protein